MDPEKSLMPPAVLLLWSDTESGERLRIIVHGPPEFLEELRSEGFEPGWALESDEDLAPPPCVVVASR